MTCPDCNYVMSDLDAVCPRCNGAVKQSRVAGGVMPAPAPAPEQDQAVKPLIVKEDHLWPYVLVGLFIPCFGLALWLINVNKKPRIAMASFLASIVGFLIGFVMLGVLN